jgi:hypothetical protein
MRATFCALAMMVLVSPAGRADEPPANDAAVLRAKIKQLEAENKSLRNRIEELETLLAKPVPAADAKQINDDLTKLQGMLKAFNENPKDEERRRDLAALAVSVAGKGPYKLAWEALVKTGTLGNGMTIEEAEKILGPATDRTKDRIGWYHNPNHARHVAPYLNAKVTKDGLSDWSIVNR